MTAESIVREHVYVESTCVHCGDKKCDNDQKDRSCIARVVPRPVPTSIFANLGEIGDELKKIQKAEGR